MENRVGGQGDGKLQGPSWGASLPGPRIPADHKAINTNTFCAGGETQVNGGETETSPRAAALPDPSTAARLQVLQRETRRVFTHHVCGEASKPLPQVPGWAQDPSALLGTCSRGAGQSWADRGRLLPRRPRPGGQDLAGGRGGLDIKTHCESWRTKRVQLTCPPRAGRERGQGLGRPHVP